MAKKRQLNHRSTLDNYQTKLEQDLKSKNFRIKIKHHKAEEFKENLTKQLEEQTKIKSESKKQI